MAVITTFISNPDYSLEFLEFPVKTRHVLLAHHCEVAADAAINLPLHMNVPLPLLEPCPLSLEPFL